MSDIDYRKIRERALEFEKQFVELEERYKNHIDLDIDENKAFYEKYHLLGVVQPMPVDPQHRIADAIRAQVPE